MRNLLTRLIIAVALLSVSPVQAKDLKQRHKDLLERVEQGIGGYTGNVRPMKYAVQLRYGPERAIRSSAYMLIHGGDFLFEVDTQTSLESFLSAPDLMITVVEFQNYRTDSLALRDGINVSQKALPPGTKVVVFTDRTGGLRGANILSSRQARKGEVPEPGSAEFAKLIRLTAGPVLAAASAVQGDSIFLPMLFSMTGISGRELDRGVGPTLKGIVECGGRDCLLVEVDEELVYSAQGYKVKSLARGHMTFDALTLAGRSAFIRVRSEVTGATGTTVTDTFHVSGDAR